MGKSDRYKVVLDGTILPNAERDQVIHELCEIFHARRFVIERLLSGSKVTLKKQYTRTAAETICKSILSAGAGCRVYLLNSSVEATTAEGEGDDEVQLDDSDFLFHKLSERFGSNSQSNGVEEPPVLSNTVDEKGNTHTAYSKEEFAGFVQTSLDDYAEYFSGMNTVKNPEFRPSWHWPAFFAFFFWAVYRKMWFWAGLHLVGAYLLVTLYPALPVLIIYSLAWPVSANALYYRHFCYHIRRSRSNNDPNGHIHYLKRKGGVSKIAVWIAVAGSIIISSFSSNMVVNDFVAQYEQQYGSTQGDATIKEQTRGDGAALELAGDSSAPLAETSRMLATMATGLKVIIAAGNNERLHETLDQLMTRLGEGDILDAWGNTVLVERELEHITLLSPGPDGNPRTDDDVIHRVNY